MAHIPRIGDVFELEHKNGLSYVQYTYCDPIMGELVRVFPSTFSERPKRFHDLVMAKEAFFVYYSLRNAVKQNLVRFVISADILPSAQGRQNMRQGWKRTRDGRVISWRLFEGENERIVQGLSEAETHYSFYGIVNHEYLKWQMSTGWRPETARENDPNAPAVRESQPIEATSKQRSADQTEINHYIYYPTPKAAYSAAVLVQGKGFSTQVDRIDDGTSWLLLAKHKAVPSTETIDSSMALLEDIARLTGGNYDGHEVRIP